MLANHFKIARRTLLRHKSYTLLNVLGLALGMGCGILIFQFVSYHLSFDRFHADTGRVYRMVTDLHEETVQHRGSVPTPLGKAFRKDYPFADKVARMVVFDYEQMVSLPAARENNKFSEPAGVAYAEPEFLQLFNFPLVVGDSKTALREPNTGLITQRLASKYFGKANPLGRTIQLNNRINVRITGVLKDFPPNTDFRQEVYVSYPTMKEQQSYLASDESWGAVYGGSSCFVRLKPGVSEAQVEKALPALSRKYYNEKEAKQFQFALQPLADVHFNPAYGGHVSKNQLLALALIGVFLVITACVNFINLATAQALRRAKEIGVRKALGSRRGQLFWQFITETALITSLALVFASALVGLVLPFANQLLQTRLTFNLFGDYQLIAFLVVLATAVTFVSGAYPGLVLTGFEPIRALKGKVSQQQVGGFSLRRSLVITQFALCQVLVIGTIVVTGQMRYSRQADMGFVKEAIVMLPTPVRESATLSSLATRIAGVAGVDKVSLCMDAPASPDNDHNNGIRYAGREEERFSIKYRVADVNYLSAFGLTLVAGRNLAPSDTVREYLLNETAVKKLQVASNEEVLGKKAVINGKEGTIVGVIKDYHNDSFRAPIAPQCITTKLDNYLNCAVRIDPQALSATLPALQQIWTSTFPQHVYSYEFLDERLAKFYQLDKLMLQLIQFFAGVAILIGCLGLYGLVSFMAAQKTKEIGLRKVLGASISQILWLFGKEFTFLLGIAFLLAAPVGWWTMRKYLEDYQYKIQLGPAIFLLAVAITFLIALLTVGYRSLKAALVNPVQSLRSE
ncbi:MAG: ABC transporter permease [Cytophagales bacterium]|nr:ABC transporter permease [Cytophagales bacterium]